VIVYVPAGVPVGLGFPPPLLLPPLEPQPKANNISRKAAVPMGINFQARRLHNARKERSEIPRRLTVAGHGSMRMRLLVVDGGTIVVRDVVVMTKEAVEPAFTVTGVQAAPVGKPEHVNGKDAFPTSVMVKVAGVPAETVCAGGVALMEDRLPADTFKTVLPPARSGPASGGPNGATMM
jgi:hypothetical protein